MLARVLGAVSKTRTQGNVHLGLRTLVTIGIFLFAYARSFEMLLLSQFVIAVGACSGFVGAGYVGGQWFGMAKFSFMFGLVQFAASFFSAFNQTLLTFAVDNLDWRGLFVVIGMFGVALFALRTLFIRNPSPPKAAASLGVKDFSAELARACLR